MSVGKIVEVLGYKFGEGNLNHVDFRPRYFLWRVFHKIYGEGGWGGSSPVLLGGFFSSVNKDIWGMSTTPFSNNLQEIKVNTIMWLFVRLWLNFMVGPTFGFTALSYLAKAAGNLKQVSFWSFLTFGDGDSEILYKEVGENFMCGQKKTREWDLMYFLNDWL